MKKIITKALLIPAFLFSAANINFTQELPPEPSAPRAVQIPMIHESVLPNGLKIVVVERKNVPLVNVTLLIGAGAESETTSLAGATNMTASILTKGTKTRSAEAIAEQMEFLGSGLSSWAGWYGTSVGFNATSDKLMKTMPILADVVLNPTFPQSEIDLLKSQMIDELSVGLKQPGTLARYVAAQYSFGEHSVQGTPESIKAITRKDILDIYRFNYTPKTSTLIFTGDITKTQATTIAKTYFGNWKSANPRKIEDSDEPPPPVPITLEKFRKMKTAEPIKRRILVVDLPNSGQAAVSFTSRMTTYPNSYEENFQTGVTRTNKNYFPASVTNSLLGGGYSSRMNQEIRIKRGLSYGAGSSIIWRKFGGNFSTRCQTKTVSAAEVAELTIKEIDRLINETAPNSELTPRKNVLNGDFGRTFETNSAISAQISELLTYGLPMSSLSSFMTNSERVTAEQVKDFALFNLKGGDIIIVGDYADFRDDLAKRFPNQKIEVIKADDLDLNKPTLRK